MTSSPCQSGYASTGLHPQIIPECHLLIQWVSVLLLCECVWLSQPCTPWMCALKDLFKHTSSGLILLVQPPGVVTYVMLLWASLLRTSSRWPLNVSDTNKAGCTLVCFSRTLHIHFYISLWSMHQPCFPFLCIAFGSYEQAAYQQLSILLLCTWNIKITYSLSFRRAMHVL